MKDFLSGVINCVRVWCFVRGELTENDSIECPRGRVLEKNVVNYLG